MDIVTPQRSDSPKPWLAGGGGPCAGARYAVSGVPCPCPCLLGGFLQTIRALWLWHPLPVHPAIQRVWGSTARFFWRLTQQSGQPSDRHGETPVVSTSLGRALEASSVKFRGHRVDLDKSHSPRSGSLHSRFCPDAVMRIDDGLSACQIHFLQSSPCCCEWTTDG